MRCLPVLFAVLVSLGGGCGVRTVEEQCRSVCTAWCNRAIQQCGVPGRVADCVVRHTAGCCGTRCKEPAQASEAAISTCVEAIGRAVCSIFQRGDQPGECVDVVRR